MKVKENNLKIIAATMLCIFTLFSVFVSTIAWFLANRYRTLDGEGFITSKIPCIITSVSVYNQAEVINDSSTYTKQFVFEQTPSITYTISENDSVTSTGSQPSLGTYDIFEESRSLLFVFEINPEIYNQNEEISLSINCITDTTLDDSLFGSGDSNNHNYTLKSSGNPQSSIIQFSSCISFDSDEKLNALKKTYTYADSISASVFDFTDESFTSSLNTTSGFATVDNDLKLQDYSQKCSFYSASNQTISSLPKYIAMVVSYNENAFQYIYNANLGNDVTFSEENINFDNCDWSLEIC